MDEINITVEEMNILNLFRNRVGTGTDVKLLQYELFAKDRCNNVINLAELLTSSKTVLPVIMLNIEKDIIRYKSCIEEMKKISTTSFIHLKATYWKEKTKFTNDINFILEFLKKFNPNIILPVSMNAFSEWNDPNIFIQDGPLACYCTHVRGLIYGYYNFDSHFVIVEDDILIANTATIEKYITQVPEDWDIICLNAMPINQVYTETMYKFINTFHSTHFYIINKKCLPTIFKNIYPITDQIDILISQLYDRLNIYNIVGTVYQKNFSTNTQNNLYVIYNSPNYSSVRGYIKELEQELLNYIDEKIPDNDNKNIRDTIIFDVIYNYIVNSFTEVISTSDASNIKLEGTSKLFNVLYIIIHCCVKGINVDIVTTKLLEDIYYIIDCFKMHKINNLKALAYGSTANVYISDNLIYKIYNERLRWSTLNHDNIDKIFEKEVSILKLVYPDLIIQEKTIIMKYLGISLYQSFILPDNWKEQIKNIFDELDSKGIFYPEFNIKNIVVKDNIISFIDYGLASLSQIGNDQNCKIFIELLDLLKNKFAEIDESQYHILYITFVNNLKIEGNYEGNIY